MLACTYHRQASLTHCRLLYHLISSTQAVALKPKTFPQVQLGATTCLDFTVSMEEVDFTKLKRHGPRVLPSLASTRASLGKVSIQQAQMVFSPDLLSFSYYSFNSYLTLLSDAPKNFPREHPHNSQVPLLHGLLF